MHGRMVLECILIKPIDAGMGRENYFERDYVFSSESEHSYQFRAKFSNIRNHDVEDINH